MICRIYGTPVLNMDPDPEIQEIGGPLVNSDEVADDEEVRAAAEALRENRAAALEIRWIRLRPRQIAKLSEAIGEHSTNLRAITLYQALLCRGDLPLPSNGWQMFHEAGCQAYAPLLAAVRRCPNLSRLELPVRMSPESFIAIVDSFVTKPRLRSLWLASGGRQLVDARTEALLRLISSTTCPKMIKDGDAIFCRCLLNPAPIARFDELLIYNANLPIICCGGDACRFISDPLCERCSSASMIFNHPEWRVLISALARNHEMQWRNVHALVSGVAIALSPLRLTPWALLGILDWLPPASMRLPLREGGERDIHALRKLRLVEAIARSYAVVRS